MTMRKEEADEMQQVKLQSISGLWTDDLCQPVHPSVVHIWLTFAFKFLEFAFQSGHTNFSAFLVVKQSVFV